MGTVTDEPVLPWMRREHRRMRVDERILPVSSPFPPEARNGGDVLGGGGELPSHWQGGREFSPKTPWIFQKLYKEVLFHTELQRKLKIWGPF